MSGPYRVPQHRDRRFAVDDQQDAGRHLSRAGPLRDRFLPRAAVRHGRRAISASTASSSAGAISIARSRDALPDRDHRAVRAQGRVRQRRLSGRRSTAASPEFGWAEKAKLKGKLIDGRYHGLARRAASSRAAPPARRKARGSCSKRDGTVTVYMGSSAVGQGVETVFAQIAADALEVPMDRIHSVFHGSTAYVSDGYGAYHSRSIVMGGSAVLDAATKLRAAMRAEAARRLGCGAAEVVLDDDKRDRARRQVGVVGGACAGADRGRRRVPQQQAHLRYGAHAAHVAVDAKTGHVELVDYVAVEDVGRIINPLTLQGPGRRRAGAGPRRRVPGASRLRRERPAPHRLARRLSAADRERFSEHPRRRASRTHPSPINPLGAKGAGEGGIIAVGGVHRQRGRRCAAVLRRRAARAAAVAAARLAARAGRAQVTSIAVRVRVACERTSGCIDWTSALQE